MQRVKSLDAFASASAALCAINCSVLPAVVAMVPLASAAVNPAQMELMHDVLHAATMYVAVPVGAAAVFSGYTSHKQAGIAGAGAAGLAGIVAGHMHLVPCEYTGIASALGAAVLIGAQWRGRQAMQAQAKLQAQAEQGGGGGAQKTCCKAKAPDAKLS